MPREFIPRSEYVIPGQKMFSIIQIILDMADKWNWSEKTLANVLGNWEMPNEPILSEN